jgi:hypothetical protein
VNVQTQLARAGLLFLDAAVAVTAAAGGAVLVVGSYAPALGGDLVPPREYLTGSPFDSFLVPGLVLALVVGGSHAVAFVMQLRRSTHAMFWSAVAAFAVLIWIFVQMLYIPFSFLQAVYFACGLAEAGLVMLGLGVLGAFPAPVRAQRTFDPGTGGARAVD